MATTEPEIDNPFNDGLPEGDNEPEADGAAAPPMTPLQDRAAEQSKRVGARRPRRRGGPRQQPGTETASRAYVASDVPEGLESRDAAVFWPQILKEMADKGVGPEDMYIRIDRLGRGITPQGQVTIDQVDANLVCGDQTGDAGRDLVTYVTDIVHLGREKLNSPADYKLYVVMKQGLSATRMMTLHLDHPDEIRALQQRKSAYFRPQPPGYRASPRAPVGMGAPMQQPPAPLPPPPPMQAPNPQLSPADAFAQTMQSIQAYEAWRQQVVATGAPMPAPLPPPPQIIHAPPPAREEDRLTKEEKELLEEARFRRFVEKEGYVKQGLGAPPPPAAAAQAAQNPVSAVKDLIKTFAEIQGLESQVKSLFGVADKVEPEEPEPEEKPNPIKVVAIPGAKAYGRDILFPRGTDGLLDWCQQAVMANLETSGQLAGNVLGTFAKSLDGTSFSRLLERLMAQGGAPAQVAAEAKAAGLVGTGAPPANGMSRKPGPLA